MFFEYNDSFVNLIIYPSKMSLTLFEKANYFKFSKTYLIFQGLFDLNKNNNIKQKRSKILM